MEKIWVVAADSVRARLFQAEHITGPLHEVRDMVNPESRLKERELVADDKGRDFSEGAGEGNTTTDSRRQKFEPPSEKEHQAEMFAREIVGEIERLRTQGELERVHILAEPGFLGKLRDKYTGPLEKCIGEEVTNHATQNKPEEIRELLPYRM